MIIMPRTARITAPGLYYHIFNRGINRMVIFRKGADYLRFLQKLAVSRTRFDWIIYSYCLLPNHYHLQVKAREDHLAKILSSLQASHSGYFNRKYKRTGSVLQGRFRSIIVQKEPYHLQLSKYIHLNPVKAKLVNVPADYPYSSYSEIIGQPKHPYRVIDKRAIKSLTGSLSEEAIANYQQFIEEKDELGYDPQLAVRGVVGSNRFSSQFE
ncbi:MAG: hypothetical protein ACD_38C00042G0001 [uncultured bacterium]|nr:MAG: hypothetical protein ACD_38C00042G0001 [uncultured bacterium]